MNGQKTTVVVRLILEKDDQILFLKKTPQNGGGYSLVGGKLEVGEGASEALIRESHEEANIAIKRKHLRLIHIFKRETTRELILVYTAKKWKGNLESKELNKFKSVMWIPKEQLPSNISQVTQNLLDAYFQKKFFMEEFPFNIMEE